MDLPAGIGGALAFVVGAVTGSFVTVVAYRVPRELSIVGCDNLPISSQITPGLSTVLLPTYELGQRAALTLLDWLTLNRAPEDTCLPIELVVRGTSGPPPA